MPTKKPAKKTVSRAPAKKPARSKPKTSRKKAPAGVDVAELTARIADLVGELAGANAERLSALDRLADLERRLAESAAVAAPTLHPDDVDERVTEAVRRAWDLEREVETLKERLEQEERARSDGPSIAEGQLRARIDELEAALARREEELQKLLPQAEGDLLVCPRCRGKMVEFVHLGVTLDRCTACAGLFFDSGELQEVLRREYPEPAEEPAPPAMPGDGEAPRRKGFFRTLFGKS